MKKLPIPQSLPLDLEVELDPKEEELFDMYEQNGFGNSVYEDD